MVSTDITKEQSSCSRRSHQPVHVAQVPDALLKIRTVAQLVGVAPATIWRWVSTGSFPGPLRIGMRCTRWRAGDVTTWLRGQADQTKG